MNKICFEYSKIKSIRKQILSKYKKADKHSVEQILFKIIYPDIDSNIVKETLKIRESLFNDCFLEIKKNMFKRSLNLLDNYKHILSLNIIETTKINDHILSELNKYGFQLDNIECIKSYFSKLKTQLQNNPISYSLTDYLNLFYFLNTEELKTIELNDVKQEDILDIVNIIKNKIKGNENSREVYFLEKMEKEKIIYKEGLMLEWIEENLSIEEIVMKIKENINEENKIKNNYEIETHVKKHNDYLGYIEDKTKLSISIESRKNTCIIGSSGSGKTTLAYKLIAEEINKGNNFLIISGDSNIVKNIQYFIKKEKKEDVFYTTANYFDDTNKDLKKYFNNNKTIIFEINHKFQEKNKIIDRLLKEIDGTKTKLYIDDFEYLYKGSFNRPTDTVLNKIKNISNDFLIVSHDNSLIEKFKGIETDFIFGKTNDIEFIKDDNGLLNDYNGSLRDFYNLEVGKFILKRNDEYKRFNLEFEKYTSMNIICNSSYFNLVY